MPVTAGISRGGYIWNGSAWVPAPGSATDGAKVDTELPPAAAVADGTTAPVLPGVDALQELYNGSGWDRQRGNTEGTLLASASRTGTQNSPTTVNHNARGVLITFVSTVNGTGSAAIKIVGVVGSSGATYLTATYLTAVYNVVSPSVNVKHGIELYPGATGAVGAFNSVMQRTSGSLPRSWYVEVNTPDAWTYSLTYALIV